MYFPTAKVPSTKSKTYHHTISHQSANSRTCSKNVMLHCNLLSFTQLFSHLSVHQDNRTKFENLLRETQLNCAMDIGAKRALLSLDANNLPQQQIFPLEAIYVGRAERRWRQIRAITSGIMYIAI